MSELIQERAAIEGYEGWADVEILGHRRRTGEVRNVMVGDRVFLRVREPAFTTTFRDEEQEHPERVEIYNPQAIFALLPLADEQAALEELRERSDIPF